MKQFVMRVISAGAVLLLLAGYNHVLSLRETEEEIARLSARLAAYDGEKAGAAHSLDAVRVDVDGQSAEDTGSAGYKDGVYTGTGDGFGGAIEVQVTVDAGDIAEITILSADGEDGAYLSMAQEIIQRIIDSQDTQADTVSGATFSSSGIRDAVEAALDGAI